MKLIPAPVISCSCILQPAKQTCRRSGCSTSSPTLTPAPTVSRAGHACPPAHRCACDQLRYSCCHLKLHFDTPDAQPSESLSLLASGMTTARAARLFYQMTGMCSSIFLYQKKSVVARVNKNSRQSFVVYTKTTICVRVPNFWYI